MNIAEAVRSVEQAFHSSVETWPGYSPASTPIAIFDKNNVAYLNHPSPPQERPEYLLAATSTDINGIKTATVPVEMLPDKQALVPLVFHECFHVYQDSGCFQFKEQFNFFKALSFYPELNGAYRALCLAESEVLNNSALAMKDKAVFLAALTKQRYGILSVQEGLLAFEKCSERREGTASFVEQQARTQLFDMPLETIPIQYGWSRQYSIGAAACWLLDELVEKWQTLVESGEAPAAILIKEFAQENITLSALSLAEKIARESEVADRIRKDVQVQMNKLMESGALRIQLPVHDQILRSFSPKSIKSMGNGRLIHTEFLVLQMPSGNINLQGELIIEDYNQNELIFPIVPLKLVNGHLETNVETVQLSLTGVEKVADNVFKMR